MPTSKQIAETIEGPNEDFDINVSHQKFITLKNNLKEIEGLDWIDVKDWNYVGGFKHPDREHGEPCLRSQKLEDLFMTYYPKTGSKWLAYLKVMVARENCYCNTEIYWQYIIVKDLDVFNVMPNIYYSKKRPKEFILVGCLCVKRFLGIKTPTKVCNKCLKPHTNQVPECNDCRIDGKYSLFFCDYCKERGDTKLKLNKKKKRRCIECLAKHLLL